MSFISRLILLFSLFASNVFSGLEESRSSHAEQTLEKYGAEASIDYLRELTQLAAFSGEAVKIGLSSHSYYTFAIPLERFRQSTLTLSKESLTVLNTLQSTLDTTDQNTKKIESSAEKVLSIIKNKPFSQFRTLFPPIVSSMANAAKQNQQSLEAADKSISQLLTLGFPVLRDTVHALQSPKLTDTGTKSLFRRSVPVLSALGMRLVAVERSIAFLSTRNLVLVEIRLKAFYGFLSEIADLANQSESDDRDIFLELILDQVNDIIRYTYPIRKYAETYKEVTKKYFIPHHNKLAQVSSGTISASVRQSRLSGIKRALNSNLEEILRTIDEAFLNIDLEIEVKLAELKHAFLST